MASVRSENASGTDERGRDADTPTDIPARGWKDIAVRVKQRIKRDHVPLNAAGVAFFAFLAAVPALAAVISVSGLLLSADDAQDRVEELFEAAPEEARDLLAAQLASVAEGSGGALSFSIIISLLLSIWAASSGMGHLMTAINIAYSEEESRGWFKRKLVALLLTLGAIVFVLLAIAVISALPAVLQALDWPGWMRWLLSLLVWPVLGAIMAAGLGVLYRKAPDRRDAEWRWVSTGSIIAVVVWAVASIGFQVYTANFASYNETYGSLAAIVILLIWLWLSAFAVLLGAHINAEMEHQTAHDSTEGGEQPFGERDATMADTVGEPHA
jgi:membrane protein